MAGYVTARVSEQRVFGIRCPHEGCSIELHDHDVKRLSKLYSHERPEAPALEPNVYARFAEIRQRKYSSRLETLHGEDIAMMRLLWDTAKLCPRCNVVLQRSHGCNHFYCICGHTFGYASAPRAVGSGDKNFGKVLALAEDRGISVMASQAVSGNPKAYKQVLRLQANLGLAFEGAVALHSAAKAGERQAIDKIRASRAIRAPPVETIDEHAVEIVDDEGFQLVCSRATKRAIECTRRPFWHEGMVTAGGAKQTVSTTARAA
eukprot:SAG31_NODE_125_length_23649_cov_7.156202_6_plen_262_part_00